MYGEGWMKDSSAHYSNQHTQKISILDSALMFFFFCVYTVYFVELYSTILSQCKQQFVAFANIKNYLWLPFYDLYLDLVAKQCKKEKKNAFNMFIDIFHRHTHRWKRTWIFFGRVSFFRCAKRIFRLGWKKVALLELHFRAERTKQFIKKGRGRTNVPRQRKKEKRKRRDTHTNKHIRKTFSRFFATSIT